LDGPTIFSCASPAIYEWYRRKAKSLGITDTSVARLMEVAQSTAGNWKQRGMSYKTLTKVARACGWDDLPPINYFRPDPTSQRSDVWGNLPRSKHISAWLFSRLDKLGISASELARKLGKSRQLVSQWKQWGMTYRALVEVANAYEWDDLPSFDYFAQAILDEASSAPECVDP